MGDTQHFDGLQTYLCKCLLQSIVLQNNIINLHLTKKKKKDKNFEKKKTQKHPDVTFSKEEPTDVKKT